METKKSLGNRLWQLAWGIQTHVNARSSCDLDGNKHIISKLTAVSGIQIHVNASSKRDYHGNKHIIMKSLQLAMGIQVHVNARSTCDFKRNKHINS